MGDNCARLSACSSLAIPYLPDAGGDSAQPHEVARQDRRRWRHALKLLWDMRRFAPSVMGPAAPATGFAPSVMGPTLASSSAAMATGLAAPPSHRLLSAIIGQRPRGVTAPGHRPLSVVIGHRPRVFQLLCRQMTCRRAPFRQSLSPIRCPARGRKVQTKCPIRCPVFDEYGGILGRLISSPNPTTQQFPAKNVAWH